MPRRYRKLSNLDRARALGQLQAGQSSRRVAMAFNTSRQSIDRIRQRYAASGDVKDLPRSGRPRATNCAEDRLITNTTLRNRFTNAPTTTRWIRQQRGAYPSLFKPSGTDHLFGKELFILFAASAFRKLSSIYVFSYLVIDLTSSCGAFPTPNGQQWHLPRWQRKAASGKNCRRISAS